MSTDSQDLTIREHFQHLRRDVPAGLVVFLVALPLCLGIAHASGAPPVAGLITGIVGGLLVALASGSHTGVSGPAAGLIVIVLGAYETLGYGGLLLATVLAGGMQLFFGVARFGGIARLFPGAVVRGMLVAIGLILVLKQIPHGVGYSGDFEGDEAFFQADGRNTFTEIPYAVGHFHIGAVLITMLGLALILLEEKLTWLKKMKWLPGPLLAVLSGVALNELFLAVAPSLAVSGSLLVQMPTGGVEAVTRELSMPDFTMIGQTAVWTAAFTIAVIASIETLLCAEALDTMDPLERKTPSNRELVAQGLGNTVAGFLGGIPMTAVIVRGSANIQAGSRTRMSSFVHGLFLLAAVLVLAPALNRIPLAALAAVLLHVGYKLARPGIFQQMLRRPPSHSVPFVVTVGVIMFTDLLTGVLVGFGASLVFMVYEALRARHQVRAGNGRVQLRLGPTVPWLSKTLLRNSLAGVPDGAVVEIDGSSADTLAPDIREELERFAAGAKERRIEVDMHDLPDPNAAAH